MPRAKRVCGAPSCPRLTDGGRCAEHRQQVERARGTRQQRGYDKTHDRLRKQWEPQVVTGKIRCARCGEPITGAWDLGHTEDRTAWTGPEHAGCNRAAGGRATRG